jgi:cell division protein FtsN
MLFDKPPLRRGVRTFKFRIPEEDNPKKKIPTRLAIGLLTPFIVVTVCLMILSQKEVLVSSVSKPVPIEQRKKAPMRTMGPIKRPAPQPTPVVITRESLSPETAIPEEEEDPPPSKQDLTFFKTLKEEGIPKTKMAPISSKNEKKEIQVASIPVVIEKPKQVPPALLPPLTNKETPPLKQVVSSATKKMPVPPVPPPPLPVVIEKLPSPSPAIKKEPPPAKTVVAPTTASPSIRPVDYALQIGAFPDKAEAQSLAFKLKSQKHGAYILVGKVPGKGTWYRVRVGHYSDRSAAETAGKKLVGTGGKPIPFLIVSNK